MSRITTHVLDTARGRPAAGIRVTLSWLDNEKWRDVASGVTNDDGRVPGLVPDGTATPAGTYRMRFETGVWLKSEGLPVFYPVAEVVCVLEGSGHYHIPLLLSPYGYSTYRGS